MNRPSRTANQRPQSTWSRILRGLQRDAWARFVIVLLIAAVLAFAAAINDNQTRTLAQDLADHGRWATATNVQVHVNHVSGRSDDYWEVDDARLVLPRNPTPITLQGAQFTENLPANTPEGWQAPNANTGYTPPLTVRVRYDENGIPQTAMADTDLTFWTDDNHDPEWEALTGAAALAVIALIMVVKGRRRTPTGYYKPSARQARRAQTWADHIRATGTRTNHPEITLPAPQKRQDL